MSFPNTFVGHPSQKLWPTFLFWEIAHYILHCIKWRGVLLPLGAKFQQNSKNKSWFLGNLSTNNCGLNAKFEIFYCPVSDWFWSSQELSVERGKITKAPCPVSFSQKSNQTLTLKSGECEQQHASWKHQQEPALAGQSIKDRHFL